MKFKHLLAKSSKTPKEPQTEETLIGHTNKVLDAAKIVWDCLSEDAIRFCSGEILENTWREAILASAWLHDLGKANNHFQFALRQDFKQGIRHETLGFVVINELLEDWLKPFWKRHPEWFKSAVLFAIAGHHLKFPDNISRPHNEVDFLGNHQDLIPFWGIGKKILELQGSPSIGNHSFSLSAFGGISEKRSAHQKKLNVMQGFSENQKKFISIVKSFLMCADIPGSVKFSRDFQLEPWLKEKLQQSVTKSDLRKIVDQRLNGKPLRSFQIRVRDISDRTGLLEAGCGSGKTLGAYLWASKQGHNKRVFFCYPTTATCSEGFSGYLQEPDFEALLKHSRAHVDYELLENMPDLSDELEEFSVRKLEALETWPFPVVVCTAHTVLGLLQNFRAGIYALPSLLKAVFVFDEIHSFSPLLFQHLLKFLEVFQETPVLLMTATLPPERKTALKKVCQRRGGLTEILGPPERENAPRYSLKCLDEEAIWPIIQTVLNNEGKVLWVVNTVSKAISLAKKCRVMGFPVQPYHSRYRYKDRLKRQRTVIDGFASGKPAMLAITTQVAEMSLDLSADLLISDYAPIPSLIQRLGRLNRFEDIPEKCREGIFLKPENAAPYAKKDDEEKFFQDIERWLEKVATGENISQQNLLAAFLEVAKEAAENSYEPVFAEWIDDPSRSLKNQRSIIEPGFTIEMILEEDLGKGELEELAIPMPFPKNPSWPKWKTKGRFVIAPLGTIEYDEFWGGTYGRTGPLEPWII